jgi:hypothetical protein
MAVAEKVGKAAAATEIADPDAYAKDLTDNARAYIATAPHAMAGVMAEGGKPRTPEEIAQELMAMIASGSISPSKNGRLWRLRRDGVALFVLALAALWAGLSTLYVGKAWGTLTDAISLLAWGVAATALLAPLLLIARQAADPPLLLTEP